MVFLFYLAFNLIPINVGLSVQRRPLAQAAPCGAADLFGVGGGDVHDVYKPKASMSLISALDNAPSNNTKPLVLRSGPPNVP